MSNKSKLSGLRGEIDSLDVQIQELITRRAELGKRIAEVKREGTSNPQYFVPEREAYVLKQVSERNNGPISDESMFAIFREIMSATLAVEQLTRVAILGPEGTFTQQAAIKQFGHSIESVLRPTIEEVFNAVEAERADFGVVPVENAFEGVVNSTLDRIVESNLSLCGEIQLKVHHCLLSTGSELDKIKRVLAHTQAIAQCRRWLDRNMPNAEVETVSSNAEAVVRAKDDKNLAAIASRTAGQIYNMNLLRSNIEDRVGNTTRFLVIGTIKTKPTGTDKTSILLSQQDRPGALLRLLEPIARHNISMTKIESRPSRKAMWDYVFFIDFEGHADDPAIAALLKELEEEATLFRLLGSYPRCAV